MNWEILFAIFISIFILLLSIKNFLTSCKESQVAKIKEWILFAVIEAEKELGSGTGPIKLRYIYDKFVSRFNFIKYIISFEEFSSFVDESLDSMKDIINSNENIKKLVEGDKR